MSAQTGHRELTPPSASDDGEKPEDSQQGEKDSVQEQLHGGGDSDGRSSSDDGGEGEDEFIYVNLAEIRKEFECPICLGIIRKTRTVMECLHRFCRVCIDKAMRIGNNECPACRTHCASRRSLRDDPNFDALIVALYPDIDKYEEEELSFNPEEKDLNTQIQASIAQTSRRQAQALGKKRASTRAASASTARRDNRSSSKPHRAEHNDTDEGGSHEDSSADEHCGRKIPRRYKRRNPVQTSQGAASNDSKGNTKLIAWGSGRVRNHNRHGGPAWANSFRCSRLSRLANHLQQRSQENHEAMIHLVLVPLKGQRIPMLNRPYLSCTCGTTVKHLCQFVSIQTSTLDPSRIEMLIIKDVHPVTHEALFTEDSSVLNPCPSKLQLLDENETLEEIQAKFMQPNPVFAYRTKVPTIFL